MLVELPLVYSIEVCSWTCSKGDYRDTSTKNKIKWPESVIK